MGTWGTSIFSDDFASDVRDSYKEFLGEGKDDETALQEILKDAPEPDDDVECSFWFGLAATQWKCGRLDAQVKAKALELIDSGADARHWEELGGNPKDLVKRKAVVASLRQQLLSPQPERKKIKPRYHAISPWAVGDVVAYHMTKEKESPYYNKWVAFHVCHNRIWHNPKKGYEDHLVYIRIFDWCGEDVPSINTLCATPYIVLFPDVIDKTLFPNEAKKPPTIRAHAILYTSARELNAFLKSSITVGTMAIENFKEYRCVDFSGLEMRTADKWFAQALTKGEHSNIL